MTSDPCKSEQLRFWRGDFGNDYTERNTNSARELRARVALWAPIMARLEGAAPESILEVGANIGNNLRALRQLSDAGAANADAIRAWRSDLGPEPWHHRVHDAIAATQQTVHRIDAHIRKRCLF